MRTYDEQYIQEVFNLIPEANWIAVTERNDCFWYRKMPSRGEVTWFTVNGIEGFLGEVKIDIKWKDSLFERKWVPKYGDTIYISVIDNMHVLYSTTLWGLGSNSKILLERNLAFKTKEEAIARSKQLLGIKE